MRPPRASVGATITESGRNDPVTTTGHLLVGAVIVGKGKGALRAKLDDARFWRGFAAINVLAYLALWVVAEVTRWVDSPAFISRLSLLALILAALSWWQSGRVEVKQQDDANVSDVLEVLDGEGSTGRTTTGPGEVGNATGHGSSGGEGPQSTSPA